MLDTSTGYRPETSRGAAQTALGRHLRPPFLILPPTSKYPGVAVAHGDFGLCAVVHKTDLVMFDEVQGHWYGASEQFDPERMAAQAALDLAAAARAPQGRVCAVVWLSEGLAHVPTPPGICVSSEPEELALAVRETMRLRLVGTDEPCDPWLGAYASAALGPREQMPRSLKRLTQLVERCLSAEIGDVPAVLAGREIPVGDLVDPRYLFPAVLVCAHEDWGVTRVRSRDLVVKAPGYQVELVEDPGALLGYRVAAVRPGHPFIVLASVVALLRRYKFHSEYLIEDLVGQFARFLLKAGLDATVVDNVEKTLQEQAG